MAEALMEKKYGEFVDYSPTIIVEGVGGRTRFIEYLQMLDQQNAAQGIEIISVEIGKSLDISKEGGEVQILLEQNVKSRMQGQEIIREDSLIGIRTRRGDAWKFFNVGGQSDSILRQSYPYLHDYWKF